MSAVPLAIAHQAAPASAAGGTYRIIAGGDQNWTPGSGAIDQSSSDALDATGTITGDSQGHASAEAPYRLQAGPGIVRAGIAGTFTVPSGLAYPFDPSLQAVSATELTIAGAAGEVTTSANIHVDGILSTPVCGTGSSCGAVDVEIHAGAGVGSEFSTLGTVAKNELGLTFDAVPGGYRVHGDVRTATMILPTNTPVPITITIALGGRFAGSPAASTFGGDFADPQARYQVSFAPSGPVLNDIPAGYTVSGPAVVDNQWSDPFAAPPPPVDVTAPSVTGTPDRAANVFGWYNQPVTIDWHATDDSGIASDPADTMVTTDGKDQTVTSDPSCDPSGNCATGTVTVSLDQAPPTVACSDADPTFPVQQHSIAIVDIDVTDALSGAGGTRATGVGVPINAAGHFTVDVTGNDFAGNDATVTCPYTVVDPVSTDTTPPMLTVPPDPVVDATSPTGAVVSYVVTASDAVDPAPLVVCTPQSGSRFSIGTTTVSCTATDASGNGSTATFHVQVLGSVAQITRLIDTTRSFLDMPSLGTVLTLPLRLAAAALTINRPALACLALDAYVALMRAAPAQAFTAAERAELLADAGRIRAAIGCR